MILSKITLPQVKGVIDQAVERLEEYGISRPLARNLMKARAVSTIYALGDVVVSPSVLSYLTQGVYHVTLESTLVHRVHEIEEWLDKEMVHTISMVDGLYYYRLIEKVKETYHKGGRA